MTVCHWLCSFFVYVCVFCVPVAAVVESVIIMIFPRTFVHSHNPPPLSLAPSQLSFTFKTSGSIQIKQRCVGHLSCGALKGSTHMPRQLKRDTLVGTRDDFYLYGVATTCRLLKIIGLFCRKAL